MDRIQTRPRSPLVRQLRKQHRLAILIGLLVAVVAALLVGEPVPQDPSYHRFADGRDWLGIANFGNVASNLPFALAGGLGLWLVMGPRGRSIFDRPADRWPYAVLFGGVALVSLGSAYYHAAPDNGRLVWDRLPMTLAFMALFAAFVADRIDRRAGIYRLLPVLLAAGIASVGYWIWTESLGRGDLRPYLVVQFYPILALPLIAWLFPATRYTTGRHLFWLIAWYGAAKAFEVLDARILAMLGGLVSGHTLKHLAAAVAVLVVIRMILSGAREPQSDRSSR